MTKLSNLGVLLGLLGLRFGYMTVAISRRMAREWMRFMLTPTRLAAGCCARFVKRNSVALDSDTRMMTACVSIADLQYLNQSILRMGIRLEMLSAKGVISMWETVLI